MRIIAVVGLALACAGCATVTRGTTSQIQIVSEPPGAYARTSIGHTCTTPCTISLSRKDQFSVVFDKEGYETETVPVTTQIAGSGAAGFAGNVLLGGVIGMGVDAATGATYEHVPNPVSATLRPIARLAPPPVPSGKRSRGKPVS